MVFVGRPKCASNFCSHVTFSVWLCRPALLGCGWWKEAPPDPWRRCHSPTKLSPPHCAEHSTLHSAPLSSPVSLLSAQDFTSITPALNTATMSELAFCKTFLGAIDSRPVKLSSDYVSDARTYPATGVVRCSLLATLQKLTRSSPFSHDYPRATPSAPPQKPPKMPPQPSAYPSSP
jgi:hypothetical protein